jgi:hypothetical protein
MDTLKYHIQHRLFSPMQNTKGFMKNKTSLQCPNYLEKEALYIPIGWDSLTKITSFQSDFKTNMFSNVYPKKDETLLDSVKSDYSRRVSVSKVPEEMEEEIEIKAQDEQEFLASMTSDNRERQREIMQDVSEKLAKGNAIQDGSQNEVLANFFQSLLSKKK